MEVVLLSPQDAAEITDVFCEAFRDYPVMRYVIGKTKDYDGQLTKLIKMFVANRALKNDPMFGIREDGNLVAVITTSNPAEPPHPDFANLQTSTWKDLGFDAQERYAECIAAWDATGTRLPQIHVNMIGVRDSHRRRGLGRKLLERVHQMCADLDEPTGVTLTTELPQNVEFYKHMGYMLVGQANVTDDLEVWNMFRRKNA